MTEYFEDEHTELKAKSLLFLIVMVELYMLVSKTMEVSLALIIKQKIVLI